MKRILSTLFVSFLAVAGFSSARAANLVTNGSFEQGTAVIERMNIDKAAMRVECGFR